MTLSYKGRGQRKSRGQILLIFAIVFPVLLMFVGLALDVGFAWIMKALLSRSVDAAALAGMRNIDLGTSKAQQIAQEAFNANFGSGFNRDTAAPTVSITVGKDATIGAGSTLSSDAPAGELTVARARQVTLPGWQRPTKKK